MLCIGIPMTSVLPGFLAIVQYASTPSKTVTIDNIVYRNGFYGDLWPEDLTYNSDAIEVGRNEFRRVDCEQFDWVHSSIGGTTSGTLYCAESQWEQAHAYYADSSNFAYYGVGAQEYGNRKPMTDFDPEKFDALFSFAEKCRNTIFGFNHDVKILRLSMPDKTEILTFSFFRKSNDGYFTSFLGDDYCIIDEKLLIVRAYDYANGGDGELVAIEVPAEIGQYFVELFERAEKIS